MNNRPSEKRGVAAGVSALVMMGVAGAAAPIPRDAEEVGELIAKLVELDSFDTGLSVTYSGSDFPPVAGQHQWSAGLLKANVPHARSEALVRLVGLGPHALPELLKHLDDVRPTRLKAEHSGGFGGMWYAEEVAAREGAAREVAALEAAGLPAEDEAGLHDGISEHQVTVGDVCFVIVGMVTNRGYAAVRYQPTACQVINSPTARPRIAKAVRGIWGDKPDSDALREHLLGDLESEWHRASAMVRLLYYYPERAVPMLAERARELLVAEGDDEALAEQLDFLKAVAWCDAPEIREPVRDFVLRAKSPLLINAGLPALEDRTIEENAEALLRIAIAMGKVQGDDRYSASSTARKALRLALAAFPETAGGAVREFLKGGGKSAAYDCVLACYGVAELPVEELAVLLVDEGEGYGSYLIKGAGVVEKPRRKDYLAYRICDNAYEIICRALGDKAAVCTGSRADMDRRIGSLRERLGSGEPASFAFTQQEIETRASSRDRERIGREKRRQRIEREGETPEARWYLIVLDDSSTHEEVRAACMALMTPTKWDVATNLSTFMANRRDGLPQRRSVLDEKRAAEVSEALRDRLGAMLGGSTFSLEACELACLLARWDAGAGGEALAKLMAMIREFPSREKVRPGEENVFSGWSGESREKFELLFVLLDELIHRDIPAAGGALRKVYGNASFEMLGETGVESDFLRALGAHHEDPDVGAVLREMFEGEESPWRLEQAGYSRVNSYANAGLLNAEPFRGALLKSLDSVEVVGQLRIKKDEPDYCWIDWDDGGSSGQGVEGGQAGVDPGAEPMPVRKCDALLEGVTGSVFFHNPGPEFQIYWPLEKREAAREAWRKFLAK